MTSATSNFRIESSTLTHLLGALLCAVCVGPPIAAAEDLNFDTQVAPLLVRRCLECHSTTAKKGGLDLTRKETALKGGESGAVIVPGKPDESLLWEHVSGDEMPPKKPLTAAEKQTLKAWITAGAPWGSESLDPFQFTTSGRAGYDWWALQPIKPVSPPTFDDPRAKKWIRNPIDAFVLARLRAAQFEPSPEADRRTLARRLTFDLLGLPPTDEQIGSFLADDSEDAYRRFVNRLLDSPHYGERWARHWLDVVRFGESNGFERDLPRENAWPYRNWVIDALNRDMPYDEFVRMQIAGDVQKPGDAQATIATGFLVAGPHDTVLPVVDVMRKTMRQDELEDIVGVVGQTFLGLTVHCARCHDHKFDPVSQHDYYRFAAALSGVQHGEREVRENVDAAQLAVMRNEIKSIGEQLAAMEKPARAKVLADRKAGRAKPPEPPKPMARWEFDNDLRDSIGNLHGSAHGGARLADGGVLVDGKGAYVATPPLEKELKEKTLEAWVKLANLGQSGGGVITVQTIGGATFDSIVFGEREPSRWMAGSNGFVRYQSFGAPVEDQAASRPVHVAIVYQPDGTVVGYREGKPYGKSYRSRGLQTFAAKSSQVVIGMRHGNPGGNRMLQGTILRAQLYDRALSPGEVAASAGASSDFVTEEEIIAQLSTQQRTQRTALKSKQATLEKQLQKLEASKARKVYAVVPRNPGVSRLLNRGNVRDPGQPVAPAGIRCVGGAKADFGLKDDAPDAQRRAKLAEWITGESNPLLARVIVNRVWHYHFGKAIVDTPNDFGFNGGRPSHPELLDWLSGQLRENNWSLKALHRLITDSATYRQTSSMNSAAAKIDAGNRLLWRKSPQRLEAESVRDAILAVTGQLNRDIGGRGYRDVKSYFFKGTQFYDPLDPTGVEFNRRTIYRFTARGGRSPFLDTFDCPDPSTTTPNRAVTTTPLQALALMNNLFVLQMSDQFALQVSEQVGDDAGAQVKHVYRLAYGRDAKGEEVQMVEPFVAQHGLAAFCRVVFNSNEFLYVR